MSYTELLRKRLVLGASTLLLMGSAAWADGSGYVDCASHPEETQVYAKARRTTEVVASVSCGEGFTVLLNGFIFSRIQTSDGRVGYIFSNLITPGRGPGSAQARNAAPAPAPASSANGGQPEVQASAERMKSTQVEAAPASMREAIRTPKTQTPSARTVSPSAEAPAAVSAGAATESAATTAASAAAPTGGAPSAAVETKKEAAVPAADRAALEAKAEAALSLPTSAQVMAAVNTPATSENAPAGAASADVATATAAATSSAAASSAATNSAAPSSETAASPSAAAPATVQPSADASAQPQPEAAEPAKAVEPVRPNERWERPNAGGRRTQPLVDFYGGYAFVRTVSAGTSTNLNGFMGAAAWNVKPWLQLIADSSYNVTTISGVKNVLYGNHWGPRIFIQGLGLRGHRGPGRWGITPFAEALVGGSRADTSLSGATTYSTSDNSFSMKLGGGLDVHQSRHIEIRLIDVDYYRTGFGGLHQNNYWATAGIVIRLFGGGDE